MAAVQGARTACGAILLAKPSRFADHKPLTKNHDAANYASNQSNHAQNNNLAQSKTDAKKECTHATDGAIQVAEYIVQEIKTNVKSIWADKIRAFMNPQPYHPNYPRADTVAAFTIWTERVFKKHPWDHKWQIRDNPAFKAVAVHRKVNTLADVREIRALKRKPPTNSESYWHKYKKHDYFLDVWSNIHYGYLGLACGLGELPLDAGAGVAQFLDNFTINGDAPDDVICVKIGYALFKKYGVTAQNLTAQAVLDALEAAKLTSSRDIHFCIHPNKKELENGTT